MALSSAGHCGTYWSIGSSDCAPFLEHRWELPQLFQSSLWTRMFILGHHHFPFVGLDINRCNFSFEVTGLMSCRRKQLDLKMIQNDRSWKGRELKKAININIVRLNLKLQYLIHCSPKTNNTNRQKCIKSSYYLNIWPQFIMNDLTPIFVNLIWLQFTRLM